MAKRKNVLVIGGGFTGLVAAYRLSKKGYAVTVVENAPVVGGLVSGFTLKDGTPLERAYHFLYKTDRYILDLVKELGIDDKLTFHHSSILAHVNGKPYSLVTPMDLLKFDPISLPNRVRTGLTGLYLQNVRNWDKLTKITAIDWLNKHNGKQATKVIWEPLLRGKFDVYYDKVTMAWLWGRIKVRQDSKDKGELTEKLGYFEGGFGIIIDKLMSELKKRNVTVITGTPVEAIKTLDDNKSEVTFNKENHIFDAVIATTPSRVFAQIIKDNKHATKEYRDKLTSIDYLAAVLMVFVSDEKLTDTYWHQIHDKNAPFLVMLSLSALTGTEQFKGKNIYYIGDYVTHDNPLFASMTEDEIREKWFKGVKKLFPNFNQKQVSESYVFKFGNAQHIVDINYENEKLPDYKTPLPGVFLANFSQIFPEDRGTNYAVRDGNKIADMVDHRLTVSANSKKK